MKLPMLNRLRRFAPVRAEGEGYSLAAEIPGASGKPLWSLKLELAATPQGAGEHLRLRAHLQANFASTRAALAGARQAARDGSGVPVPRTAQWLLRALERPLLRQVAAPLLQHDLNSWLELRASTADLAAGSRALLPEAERLKGLGIDTGGEGPLAQTWEGGAGGTQPGFAQVSLLRFDKRHLPARLAALLGERPFQLAAAVVNVIDGTSKAGTR
ncbi:MAG: hypothetical protein ISP90_14525 [Nevskia sp.]|nr:hypothetical protein [Nevskia sp.]